MEIKNASFLRGQLWFLLKFSLWAILLLTISRIVLVSLYTSRVEDLQAVYKIFWGGFRIDISLISLIVSIPCLLLLFTVLTKFKGVFVHYLIRIWCWLFFNLIVFMEAVSPGFITEYDTRPNRLFFEYFSSPNEVAGMLIKGYWVQIIIAILLVGVFSRKSFVWVKTKPVAISKFNPLASLVIIFILLSLVVTARSGLQHRPINPAMVAFSNDSMINSLPLNSTYSLLFAIYQIGKEASASEFYGSIDNNEMIRIVKNNMSSKAKFLSDDIPTLHSNIPILKNQRANLIIVVEESLGAQFVGSLGGKPITPSIDSWKNKSWFFEKLYATGTRSARGLEAIVTGFLPSPARAVLKLPKAQNNFYTIARTLSLNGYINTFIYGGEGHFDNMKGFFLANGFHQSIDQNDFTKPQFMGNWGVSDEDLFNRALKELYSPSNDPKFTLIFTSSNHTPFEFPDDKIALYDAEKQTVNNAVKYADFALGQFLNNLEDGGFMENSVVLVVADHDARVMGDSLVPVNRFHIPGFIMGKGVESKIDDTLVSQIDLAPTLLSLLGIDSPTPMIGHDLTQLEDGYKGRAIMQYGNNQAYMRDDNIVILQPDKQPIQFKIIDGQIDFSEGTKPDNTAIAHAQFTSWAYKNEKYRLN